MATSHHNVAVTPSHGLRGQHDGLEARAAHGVDGQRWHFLRHTRFHEGLSRWVLTCACGEHLTHDDFTDECWVELGAGDGFANHNRAQLRGGHFGERATKFANCGASGGNNDDVFLHEFSRCLCFKKERLAFSASFDVTPGCVFNGFVLTFAIGFGRGDLLARVGFEPS